MLEIKLFQTIISEQASGKPGNKTKVKKLIEVIPLFHLTPVSHTISPYQPMWL